MGCISLFLQDLNPLTDVWFKKSSIIILIQKQKIWFKTENIKILSHGFIKSIFLRTIQILERKRKLLVTSNGAFAPFSLKRFIIYTKRIKKFAKCVNRNFFILQQCYEHSRECKIYFVQTRHLTLRHTIPTF